MLKSVAMHGVAKAVRKFQEKFPGISRQTTSDFKRNFNKRKSSDDDVSEMPTKKRGRPTKLPEELMTKTVSIIKALRLKSAPVSYAVTNAVAKGVIISHDRCLLVEHGGHIKLSDD